MLKRTLLTLATLVVVSASGYISASAQGTQPQIPTLQVCNKTKASGLGTVFITSRAGGGSSGKFTVKIELTCDEANQYPVGGLTLTAISMSDSTIQGALTSTSFEQVTTTGKHTPTLYLNSRCSSGNIKGCRYWLMIADNKGGQASPTATPDIVSFLVFDGTGKRIAYGTGPLESGDLKVESTPN